MKDVILYEEDINSKDAEILIEELSAILKNTTGSDGKSSFKNEDMLNDKSIFVVARDLKGRALGCGAIRYYSEDEAEIKRMYAREKSKGVGSKIIKYLETRAKELGYKKIILETRIVNEKAVNFYKKNNYLVINNYGRYATRKEAICFAKNI